MERTFEEMLKVPEGAAASVADAGGPTRDFYDMTGQPRPAPTFLDDLVGFLSSPDEWKGMGERVMKLGEGLKAKNELPFTVLGNNTVREELGKTAVATAGAAADFLPMAATNMVAQVMATPAQIRGLAQGESPKTLAATRTHAAETIFPEAVRLPFETLAKHFGQEEAFHKNPISWAMEKVSEAMTKGADKAVEGTDVPAEHLMSAAQLFMDAGMMKAARSGLMKGQMDRAMALPEEAPIATPIKIPSWLAKEAKKEEAAAVEAAPVETPAGPPSLGEMVVDEAGLDAIFKEAKKNVPPEVTDADAVNSIFTRAKLRGAANTGPKTPEMAIEESQRRIAKAVDTRFPPSDVPKTEMTEGTVLGESPSLLDSALVKLKSGEAFRITPEERITLAAVHKAGGRIVGEDGKPLRSGFDEKGNVDPRLLATIAAAGGIAAWAALDPENAEAALALAALGTIKETRGDLAKMAKEVPLREAIRKGGPEGSAAMAEFYKESYDRTVKYIQKQFGHQGVVPEEIVQEAFMKTVEKIQDGSFEGTSTMNTYLTQASRNLAMNAVRDRKDTIHSSLESSPFDDGRTLEETLGHAETPEKAALMGDLGGQIQKALTKLDPDQMEVFQAMKVEGLSQAEAAQKLGIPEGTVKSRLSRGLDVLQRALKDYAEGGAGATEFRDSAATVRRGQEGGVDPRVLGALAAVATGTAVGAAIQKFYGNDPEKGAIVGGMLTLGGLGFFTKPVQVAVMRSSTRLANVLPALRRSVRDMELATGKAVYAASETIGTLTAPLKKAPAATRAAVEWAYKSADQGAMAAALKGHPELVAGYRNVRSFLGHLEEQLRDLGRFKKGLPEYLPLLVKDYKGLTESLGLEVREGLQEVLHKANVKSMLKEQRELTELEQSVIINNYLLNEPSTSYLPSFAKHRRLKMTPETAAFYHDLETALVHYAHAAVTDVAKAAFFGKDLKTLKKGKQIFTNVEGSISEVVRRAQEEGRLDAAGAAEAQKVLQARFIGGEKAPAGWLQDVRNVGSTALLGQIGSGLIQTSESLLSTYHHDIRPALSGMVLTATGKGIKGSEFGLANHVIEEVIGSRRSGKVLSGVLKANLLAAIDQLGIGVNLTASFVKNQRLAQTAAGRAKIVEKWGPDYGPDMPQLLEELQTSTTKARTPLVDSLLWQEISDVRPTSRIEHTELFNAHPNARLAYHLKGFMLTQADILYRDAFQKILSGEPKKMAVGLKNLALYATALSLVAVPADAIKDWMSGRGLSLDKIDYVDNFIRNFGLSRYTLDSVRTGDNPGGAVAKAAASAVTPPVFSVGKTLAEGVSEPKKLVPMVPLVGRPISDRYLGGNERREISKNRFDNKGKPAGTGAPLSPAAKEYLRKKRLEKRMEELRK